MSAPVEHARLDELALKSLFLNHLRETWHLDQCAVVASEFVVTGTGRRADLALWCGEFVGIEIKSKFDSLKRLPEQMTAYARCFDRVILVVDEKHFPKVLENLPAAIELWTVGEGGTLLRRQSAGVLRNRCALALANLCSLDKLRRLATADRQHSQGWSRKRIVDSGVSTEDIYSCAINGFKRNFGKSSKAFWLNVADGPITIPNVEALSRYSESKLRRQNAKQQNELFWQDWERRAAEKFSLSRSNPFHHQVPLQGHQSSLAGAGEY